MHPELPSRLFDDWWHHEGSGMPPLPGEDAEAHVRRICRLAWLEAADWAQGEVRTALAKPEPEGPTMFKPDGVHPFVVRHYTDDERPSIKGNGFDGLEVGEDRQEAEEFIAWINARLCPSRSN